MNQIGNAQSKDWLAVIGPVKNEADAYTSMEGITLRIKNFALPSINIGVTPLGGTEDRQLIIPGDHIELDDLTFDVHIDKDWNNYVYMAEWVLALTTSPFLLADVTLQLLRPDGTPAPYAFVYENAWPTMLMQVPLDTENADDNLQVGVTMKYDRIRIERKA